MKGNNAKGLDEKMGFGKYSAHALWEVLNMDPGYIRWLLDKADMEFDIDDEAYDYYQRQLSRHKLY